MSEDKDQERYKNKSQGRCISHIKTLHVMLKYQQIVNNLDFIKVSTIPQELQADIRADYDKVVEDGAYMFTVIESFSQSLDLDKFSLHIENQFLFQII